MNQRRQPRFVPDQPVEVIAFGPPESSMQGTVHNACGRGVGLELPAPVPTGSAIKLNLEDAFFRGEAISCREQGGSWYVRVELEHALCGLVELAAALQEFREDPLSGQHSNAVQHAQREHRQ